MKKMQSAERVSAGDISDNFVFQRSLLAYHEAARMVSGNVLEIGTGSGYGVSVVSPSAARFVTVDKNDPPVDISQYAGVEFRRMRVPPLRGIGDGEFDFVIMFQVIEHIGRDLAMLKEIGRVLRPGGKLIISTPNKKMSLTRNPWHVREYDPEGFARLLGSVFPSVERRGVFGNEAVAEYYRKNSESVARMARYDLLRFNKWLPKALLRIPYDILNRLNRRRLLTENSELTSNIRMEDYRIAPVADDCFDLFYIAGKE